MTFTNIDSNIALRLGYALLEAMDEPLQCDYTFEDVGIDFSGFIEVGTKIMDTLREARS